MAALRVRLPFRTSLGPHGRGRNIGTEATRLIVGHGLGQLGRHRIRLAVYGHSARARRVYEKTGFVMEGVRREVALRDGARADEVILDRERAALSSTAR